MEFFGKLKSLFAKQKAKGKHRKLPRVDIEKRFDLIARTGQGSMSKVWRARDRQINKVVCLKVLDKKKTEKFDARFPGLVRPTEGEILEQLRHDNIVRLFEHGITTAGEQFLVMELIEGVGLNFLIETKNAQLKGRRLYFLAQVAMALDVVHRKGFIHRDICPRNIMVDQKSRVKLIDFGLSIPATPEFCRPGNRTGTADYLAPELIKRAPTDHRVDLFALGVTAYEVITGHLPWEKGDSMQTLQYHLNIPGRDPREYVKNLDRKTTAFLLKAIERDPNRRFQTAAQFREALRHLPKR